MLDDLVGQGEGRRGDELLGVEYILHAPLQEKIRERGRGVRERKRRVEEGEEREGREETYV